MTDKKTGITYTIADIVDALKNYEELTSKPVILYGRTHGHTQALIDTICKNYKEVKITNLEDEKKLKDYQEIREIAKRYNWDDITSKIFNVETDKEYRDLFSSAIVNIQEDYRKARALEIIKEKNVWFWVFRRTNNVQEYNEKAAMYYTPCDSLAEEEYELLKEVLL